jgi:hypothetical protein
MFQHRRVARDDSYNLYAENQLQSYCLWLQYFPSENIKFSLSPICYFRAKPIFALGTRSINEFNWNVRVEHKKNFKNCSLMNRLALEYRYRDFFEKNVYVGNFRMRYMPRFSIQTFKIRGKPVNLVISDEVFFQYGYAVKTAASLFDQNRVYAGINYKLYENIKLDIGYCYIDQLRLSGKDLDIQNAFWITLTFDNVFSQFIHREN